MRHLRLHSRCLGPISQQETPPISSSLQDQDNKENVNPNHPIQQGGGDPSSDIKDDDTNDACISEEEAIEGNLKKISLEATDKSKFDPITFLKLKEENIRRILKEELAKRRRIKFYQNYKFDLLRPEEIKWKLLSPFFMDAVTLF